MQTAITDEEINSVLIGISICLGATLGYVVGVLTDERILIVGNQIKELLS